MRVNAAAPMSPRPLRLRAQLLLLVAAAAVPLLALLAWLLRESAVTEEREAREQVVQLAQMTASETSRFLLQARAILGALAERPGVRALDSGSCDPVLKDFIELAPRFVNVATVRADGTPVCSGLPLPQTASAPAEPPPYLEELRRGGDFSIGAPMKGRVTGRWIVPIAHPLRGERGEVTGAVVLPVDLVNFPVLPRAGLPDNAEAGIVRHDGTIIALSRDPHRHVGSRGAPLPRRGEAGVTDTVGVDGTSQVLGFVPIAGTDWIATATLPAKQIYAGPRARTAASTVLALGAVGAALALALWRSRRILEPIRALAAASGQVAAGNVAARAPVTGPPEIAGVARQFNAMLDAQARSREQLAHSRAALDQLSDAFYIVETQTLRIIDTNEGAARALGWSRQELLGQCVSAIFADRDEAQLRREYAAMARGAEEVLRAEHRRKDGSTFPVEIRRRLIELAGRRYLVGIARDITERDRVEAELRRLAQRLASVQEQERGAIARELHDRVGQNLAALSTNLALLRYSAASALERESRLAECLSLVEATGRVIQDVLTELKPAMLATYGLIEAMRWHAGQFSQRTGIPVEVQGPADGRLAAEVEMVLFRIAQSALSNVARHARARAVSIRLAREGPGFRFEIADDGIGFEVQRALAGGRFGLATMRERAQAIGAKLGVHSAQGEGTRIVVEGMA